jgi:hypothetical protein
LFLIQVLWLAFSYLSFTSLLSTLIPVTAVLVIASVGIWLALHPRQKTPEDAKLPPPIPPLILAEDRKDRKEHRAPEDMV